MGLGNGRRTSAQTPDHGLRPTGGTIRGVDVPWHVCRRGWIPGAGHRVSFFVPKSALGSTMAPRTVGHSAARIDHGRISVSVQIPGHVDIFAHHLWRGVSELRDLLCHDAHGLAVTNGAARWQARQAMAFLLREGERMWRRGRKGRLLATSRVRFGASPLPHGRGSDRFSFRSWPCCRPGRSCRRSGRGRLWRGGRCGFWRR